MTKPHDCYVSGNIFKDTGFCSMSIMARLFFIRLGSFADVFGIISYKNLSKEMLGNKEAYIKELSDAGMIIIFNLGDDKIIIRKIIN